MSRFILVAMLAACSGTPPEPSSIGAARATAVEPAAPARSPTTAHTTWATLAAGRITTTPLAGPYNKLEEFCVERHDDCTIDHTDVLEEAGNAHAWLATAEINSITTKEGEMPNQVRHIGLRTASGWYVLPGLADVAGNQSGTHVEVANVDGALVLSFKTEDGDRFEHESTTGLVVCAQGRTVECTPRIVSESEKVQAPRGGADGSWIVDFACTATYKAGEVVIAPLPPPGAVEHEPRRACADLPYAGERPITFPQ